MGGRCVESGNLHKKIINIGSLTTHSFADSNKHIGKYYILDTNDRSIESFEAKDQVIFRTYEINGEDDIIKLIKNKSNIVKSFV